jgi:predicted unusual protein kinase regulating ubiquinone biosynthesis (AarF/ABC1/UbiB family)
MSRPRAVPVSAAGRLLRIGVLGAGVLGRNAAARVRKIGKGEADRAAIDRRTHEANADRIFDAMSGLRGAFMKLGQMLSQQAHSLPEPYVRRLGELQWDAPPMHATLARLQVRHELGRPPEELFATFDREPFAAASLGQVHAATSTSGEKLAVKVQYPGIDRSIASDFANFKTLLSTIRLSREQFGEVWDAVEEVRRHFEQEVDYVREAATIAEFRRLLAHRDDAVIPRVHLGLSSRRVLTMERLEGRHLPAYLKSGPSRADRDAVGERLLDLFLEQAFRLGLLHADPHPGNYLFLEGGRIGLLDFGCAKRFEADFVAEHGRLIRTRIGDRDALEAQFLRDDDPRRAEKLEALVRMQKLDIAKYHEDRAFDFGDAAHLREILRSLQELLRLGLTTPGFVLYVRAKIGLYNLLHALGARVNCARLLSRYVKEAV